MREREREHRSDTRVLNLKKNTEFNLGDCFYKENVNAYSASHFLAGLCSLDH